MSNAKTILLDSLVFWKTLLIVLTPIVLMPLLFIWGNNKAAYCLYVLLIMAIYWVGEALPLPVTSLIPMVLFPTLGIMKGKTTAGFYIQDASLIFLGGLMMALAIEKSNLHKRFGLGMLLLFGSTPARLLLGFIIPTWFLSMWISNAATASMMIPTVEAVLAQYRKGLSRTSKKEPPASLTNGNAVNYSAENLEENLGYHDDEAPGLPNSINPSTPPTNQSKIAAQLSTNQNEVGQKDFQTLLDEHSEKRIVNLAKMLSLAVAYSASIGGNATLTGATSNPLVAQEAAKAFERHGQTSPLNYTTWLFFGLPYSIVCILVLWLWLQLYFLGWRSFKCRSDEGDADYTTKDQRDAMHNVLKEQYKALGPMTYAEKSALIFTILMVLLWLTRDPGFAPGYASLFQPGYVTDSVPAIFIAFLLFIFPSERPDWLCFRDRKKPAKNSTSLLTWSLVTAKLPWGAVLLLGGGFALAEGVKVSGLSRVIGDELASMNGLSTWMLVFIVTIFISLTTEIMCGCAALAIFLPILDGIAEQLHINPLYLMLPAGLAASCAYMLPTGAISNSICFANGQLKVFDMVTAGVVMNLLCILIIAMATGTWGMLMFGLQTLPWATDISNATTTTVKTSSW